MAFIELQFPPTISFGATGGLRWKTDVVELNSGFEQRNRTLSQPRGMWTVSHSARLGDDFDPLLQFINVVHGQDTGFRFKDWTDFKVEAGRGVIVPIDSTHAQLAKSYFFGANSFDRHIRKPREVNLVGGSGATVDLSSGIVTFTTTPTSWTGEFDVAARLGTDDMSADIINRNGANGELIIGWSGIPIIGIRT